MRRVRIDRPVSPGATLARDVTGPFGGMIARAGHPLSRRTMHALVGRGVRWCYVDDFWGWDLDVTPLDAGHSSVRPLLRDIERRMTIAVAPLLKLSTGRAIEVLRSSHPTAPVRRGRSMWELPGAIETFIADCAEATPSAGYLPDRVAAHDEIGHSIAVAAVTSRIASILGLDEKEQVAAVGAALFHDIGMLFVPRTIRLTPHLEQSIPQQRRVQDHAILGEAMLEPFGRSWMHLAIVAGEHHEFTDGSGYPRHREGGQRVLRTADEKRDVQRTTLLSEIVAVADAYERAVSPSADIDGQQPAAVRTALARAAGRRLNREIVDRFLGSFPAFPVGTEVRVTRGPHEGMYGIVTSATAGDSVPPRLRLYLDAAGRIIEPFEVSLEQEHETSIKVVDAA